MSKTKRFADPSQETACRIDMEQWGVSQAGIEQFLAGQIVTDPEDRSRISCLLIAALTHHMYPQLNNPLIDVIISS